MQATLATRSAAAAYTHVEVTSRSPMELVVMLYDGGIAALTQARDALARRDFVGKRSSLTKAISIISHLQSTLNMEEGREIAQQLDHLYDYILDRITTSNLTGATEPLDQSIRLLCTVRDAWVQISQQQQPPPTPAER
jgi:flagellar protein FliS